MLRRSWVILVVPTLLGSACTCSPPKEQQQHGDPNVISAKTAVPLSFSPPPTNAANAANGGAASGSASPSAARAAGSGELSWATPPTWEKTMNASPMRKATYKVPRVAGDPEDAELSVMQAGGTVAANVERWTQQFSGANPTQTERTVAGMKVTVVELHGTFQSGMPGAQQQPTAKQSWALLGAIFGDGVDNTFFKLTGPEKTVVAARGAFDTLLESVRPR